MRSYWVSESQWLYSWSTETFNFSFPKFRHWWLWSRWWCNDWFNVSYYVSMIAGILLCPRKDISQTEGSVHIWCMYQYMCSHNVNSYSCHLIFIVLGRLILLRKLFGISAIFHALLSYGGVIWNVVMFARMTEWENCNVISNVT